MRTRTRFVGKKFDRIEVHGARKRGLKEKKKNVPQHYFRNTSILFTSMIHACPRSEKCG
jgi:hypothetical protein